MLTRLAPAAPRCGDWCSNCASLGVEIAGHPATGYQLKAVPDLLLPDMLAPALKGTIFGADIHRNYHHYYRIGSTNIEAMESAARARLKEAFS